MLGGCRSGKSGYALETAQKFPGDNKIFIATCIPHDDEMKSVVRDCDASIHQLWDTITQQEQVFQSVQKQRQQINLQQMQQQIWQNYLERRDELVQEKMSLGNVAK